MPLRVKPPYAPKVTKSAILVCPECKGRYIKTRAGQGACIKCLAKAAGTGKK